MFPPPPPRRGRENLSSLKLCLSVCLSDRLFCRSETCRCNASWSCWSAVQVSRAITIIRRRIRNPRVGSSSSGSGHMRARNDSSVVRCRCRGREYRGSNSRREIARDSARAEGHIRAAFRGNPRMLGIEGVFFSAARFFRRFSSRSSFHPPAIHRHGEGERER